VCNKAQARFETAARHASDIELRAFLDDCARLRGEMVEDLCLAMSEPHVAASTPNLNNAKEPTTESPGRSNRDFQVLKECRLGEEGDVKEFRGALEYGLPQEVTPLVRRQFAVIVATCERLRSLEANHKSKYR
jgi:hypothetical protein